MATSKYVTLNRFVLIRSEDVSGTSGTGIVAEGIEFSNGQIVTHWLSQLDSINVYANRKVLDQLHGHNGKTKVQWLDTGESFAGIIRNGEWELELME